MSNELFNADTVYILDSYGLIYREYFAFLTHPLTNEKGENVSAVFGFFRNIRNILKNYNPRYMVAAFDSKTPTFRHEMYEAYKATRNKTPDDLHAQVAWIEDILKTLGIPTIRCDGYEADDIIASIASKCEKENISCKILSGDKDLMQLVGKSTTILKPSKSSSGGWEECDKDGVIAEWGVEPEQMLDMLSLMGDTADNIPGVQGVGFKTAAKLLNEYKSLDNIYSNVESIKGALGKKLKEHKDDAYFSQKLVKLCTEVPFEKSNLKDFNIENTDWLSKLEVHLEYTNAADLLDSYGVPSVAKSYRTTSDKALEPLSEETSQEEKCIEKNKGNYKGCTSLEELKNFIDEILKTEEKTVAFDTETDGLDTLKAKLVGFSLSYKKGEGIYIPLILNNLNNLSLIKKDDALKELERLFCNKNVTIVLHNGKFDYEVLRTAGINFGTAEKNKTQQAQMSLFEDIQQHEEKKESSIAFPACKIADTMIAYWLLSPDEGGKSPFALESLAEKKLHLSGVEYDDIVEKGKSFADVEYNTAANYGAEDSDFTLQLWLLAKEELKKNKLYEIFTDIEMKLLPILAEMEIRGIHLSKESLEKYHTELEAKIDSIQKDIYDSVGHEFNIASTKQLQQVLFEELKLPTGKKTKTGYSTDTAVLEELASLNAVPAMILKYRMYTKLQSTYVDTLPQLADSKERIHTTFLQTGTATGRLSSKDPNLQNIPVRDEEGRRIRSAFTAKEGTVLISADYSQIELVVLAHLSKDENLCKAFIEGTDVHKATAALIYQTPIEMVNPEMRRIAKTINFGIIYGMSAFRLAKELGISRTMAKSFIDSYHKLYSGISNFIAECIKNAEENGYVETISGRKRYIANINSKNKIEKAAAERVAVNTPIQGTAADIVKKAMINVSNSLQKAKSKAHILLQVHDELILECPDSKTEIEKTINIVKKEMEGAIKLSVPLRVSIEYGKNWGEFH
ncbi:MAG: DNA polymerase I [Treponema sp.]|nr:DNA polymerase I [Treponema sp.]